MSFRSKGSDVSESMSCITSPAFDRYVGIDYSGAQTPISRLPGLRVYMADAASPPIEVRSPLRRRENWTRRGIAEWLAERLLEDQRTLVGIDHGFSFPLRYFETHQLPLDWPAFLDDFQRCWPTDEDDANVDLVRHGNRGNGAARLGNTRWRRLTERGFDREARSGDQHDAYSVAAWMRGADLEGKLSGFFDPELTDEERAQVEVEGWILGVR